MHIINFQGGLGNQLFQYALYKKFIYLGYIVKADLTEIKKQNNNRKFSLEQLGISLEVASTVEVKKLYCDINSRLSRGLFKYFGKKTYYNYKEDNSLHLEILELKKGYFNGYWQSYKYFEDINDILLADIQFNDKEYSSKNKILLEQIKNDNNSVSLHIRLGDYLKRPDLYGGCCTENYYNNAIGYLNNNIQNATFYVFSDDIESAKKILNNNKYIYIDSNSEEYGYIDMHLMSLCRHHIIANSSFSWWGAWLSQEKNNIVVAPSKWFNGATVEGLLPDKWIKL